MHVRSHIRILRMDDEHFMQRVLDLLMGTESNSFPDCALLFLLQILNIDRVDGDNPVGGIQHLFTNITIMHVNYLDRVVTRDASSLPGKVNGLLLLRHPQTASTGLT